MAVLKGILQEKRGIRQGDPLSPFLFVLLSLILLLFMVFSNTIRSANRLNRHTLALQVTYLSSLIKGDLQSVEGIIQILELFYQFSGLKINPAKCEFFSSGIDEQTIDSIQLVSGFKKGKLPVRYLGVPLLTKKLSFADCESPFNKTRGRITGWCPKMLSFAGRLQLIQSILYGIQVFWCKHFLLPKKVLKEIERMCSCFLTVLIKIQGC